MNPRRVLIFSLVYYPRIIGGAEVAVKEITDRIDSNEYVFDLITLGKSNKIPEKIGNINVYRVGLPFLGENSKISFVHKFAYIVPAYFKAVSLHKKNKYETVWAIMASYAGMAATLFKRKFPGIYMLLTIQEGDNFERRKGVFGSFFRKIFESADRIQCISNYLKDWSIGMGAKCPIEVVPNGVDYDKFSNQSNRDKRSAIRSELGIGVDECLLVTASRLVYKNAVDDIISAMSLLDQSFKLLILGTGSSLRELREQVRVMNLMHRVIFLGYIDHKKLPAYLSASDIFIRPSRSEGLGNSFLEAMAAGIPVIATAVGGIPDFIKDGETGLFCDIDNPRSIAQKVEKISRDRESREYIVRQARDLVREKYDWQGVADRIKIFLSR